MTASGDPIPLILLTGFLGSGKTTLLNALLRDPAMTGTAVLINEVGEIGIDHSLVVGASDEILLLEGGCLCCQPKGGVAEGISRLLDLPAPPLRIVIETSGAANPVPILETISQHPLAAKAFQFPCVVTVVDCLFGRSTLQNHIEARFQVSAADILVLGKADIASQEDRLAIENIIKKENPTGKSVDAKFEMLPNGFIELLKEGAQASAARVLPELEDGGVHGETEFVTAGASFHGRLTAEAVQRWLDRVLESYGGNILRIKGILQLEEFDQPAILQSVRDIVHPLQLSNQQTQETDRNSIVAIGWDMHPELLQEEIDNLVDQASGNTGQS